MIRIRTTPRSAALATARERLARDGRSETFIGYGVMALPFASGDVLAFRRFEASSIGPPYSAVWHRDPEGRWTFYVSVEPARSCPRYFGAAIDRVVVTDIAHTWVGHDELVISTGRARLEWAMRLSASVHGALVGAAARLVPRALWREGPLLTAAGSVAGRALDAGRIGLAGATSNGQRFVLRPFRVWHVAASAALVEGRDMGPLARLPAQVQLGDFRLPKSGLFVVGRVDFEVFDAARHRSTPGRRVERA